MSASRSNNRVKEGPSCRGCGLPNYEGFCPVCRGDLTALAEIDFAFEVQAANDWLDDYDAALPKGKQA